MTKLILSNKFLIALHESGILPESCRRVVIDAQVGEPVHLYFETFGDERLIEVAGAAKAEVDISQP